MGVLVIQIVFADVDNRQLPQLRQVHDFIQRALPQCPFAEKADAHPAIAQALGGERRPRGNAHAASHNCVRAQVAGGWIGYVHGAAFAAAVARFLAQKLGKHPIRSRTLGQAVPVAAMRAGDVIVGTQCLANPYRYRLFAYIQVRQSRHQGPGVEVVHLFFKQPDAHHLPVHSNPGFRPDTGSRLRLLREGSHCPTPDISASTLKTQAKSCLAKPMARAALRNSLATAVVGKGTSSFRPISRASTISFCIMFTSNQASSGMCSTKGPRYCTMGEATALCSSTSTAVSRAMPLFSASSTPSEKHIICTARLRLVAIFMHRARPLSPT